MSSSHQAKKNSFPKVSFRFLRERCFSEKLSFRKFTTKDGVYIAGRQKSEKIACFSKYLSTIDEYNTRVMEEN